jgi:hypothetical protein
VGKIKEIHMATQAQTNQTLPNLKIKKDMDDIANSFAAISKNLRISHIESKDFAENIQKARQAAGSFDVKKAENYFREIGSALKLPEAAFNKFVEEQAKTFESQATQSFIDNMRGIHRGLGLSKEDMLKIAESFGDLGKKFEPKTSLEYWLDDRMKSLGKESDDNLTDFYDEKLPASLGKASDAIANLFMDIARGTNNSSQAFADLGKSIQGVALEITSDLVRAGMRFMLFGSEKEGSSGLLGTLVGGLGSLLGGWFGNAKGNVIASPALAACSNSIIAGPTLVPFARGGAFRLGLMGEAGPEAIMPLTRTRTGDLGVKVDVGNARRGGDTYFQMGGPVITVEYVAREGATPEADGQKISESIGAQLRREMAAFVDQRLMTQSRPGGLLNSGIGA